MTKQTISRRAFLAATTTPPNASPTSRTTRCKRGSPPKSSHSLAWPIRLLLPPQSTIPAVVSMVSPDRQTDKGGYSGSLYVHF